MFTQRKIIDKTVRLVTKKKKKKTYNNPKIWRMAINVTRLIIKEILNFRCDLIKIRVI